MKRFFFLLFLALSFAACSCNAKPDVKPDNNEENTDPSGNEDDKQEPKPGTYKFVASSLKERWNPGDRIYVHGKLSAYAEVVTLTDISADGKTATAHLDNVTTSLAVPDGLYAAWPGEAVRQAKGILGAKTSFESCDRMLTVAYLEGDTFTFTDVSSALAFTVSGDYDRYALSANDRDGVIVTDFEIEYTSQKCEFNHRQNTGYPFMYGAVEPGRQVSIWMPAEMTFNKGLTIFLGKDGSWTAVYKLSSDVVLERAECKDLGDITARVESYGGPAPVMPQITGKYTKYALSFQELSGLCLSEGEDFIWGVGDNGDLAKISFDGKVLDAAHIGGDSEDVTRNPETGDLLIGLEPNGVGVVKGPGFNTRASTLFNIPACNNYGNSGIEGLTYYKDGKVFAGAQSNSHLFFCDLESKTVEWDLKLWNKKLISEIGGLCYDPLTDWLWIIDSESKKVFVLSAEALVAADKSLPAEEIISTALLGAYPVKESSNPESVCIDHKNSCIWVGDDYGDVSYLYQYPVTGLDDVVITR